MKQKVLKEETPEILAGSTLRMRQKGHKANDKGIRKAYIYRHGEARNQPIRQREVQAVRTESEGCVAVIETARFYNRKRRKDLERISSLNQSKQHEPLNNRRLTEGRRQYRIVKFGIMLSTKVQKYLSKLKWKQAQTSTGW